MRFPGVAQLSNGDSTELELDLSPTRVEIYVGDELVEVWSTHDCRIVPEGESSFRIESADDSFLFSPTDPSAFQVSAAPGQPSVTDRIKALAGEKTPEVMGGGPGEETEIQAPTLRDETTEVLSQEPGDAQEGDPEVEPDIRLQPEPERETQLRPDPLRARDVADQPIARGPVSLGEGPGSDEPWVDLRSIPPPPRTEEAASNLPAEFVASSSTGVSSRSMLPVILAVLGTIVVVVIALVFASAFFGDTDESPAGAAPTQESVPEASAAGLIFDESPARFVQEWNEVAEELADVLMVDGASNGEAPLSPFARLEWSSEGGLLARYQVVIDPTGPPEADEQALAALGVAIAVADPSLDGPARRDLLSSLGLDVSAPDLAGIDAETDLNGVRYGLRYLPSFRTLLFGVSPVD